MSLHHFDVADGELKNADLTAFSVSFCGQGQGISIVFMVSLRSGYHLSSHPFRTTGQGAVKGKSYHVTYASWWKKRLRVRLFWSILMTGSVLCRANIASHEWYWKCHFIITKMQLHRIDARVCKMVSQQIRTEDLMTHSESVTTFWTHHSPLTMVHWPNTS